MRFRSRSKLRIIFVSLAITASAAGWWKYQLNWIRQRNAFLNAVDVIPEMPEAGSSDRSAIWPLAWFGQKVPILIYAPSAKMKRAQELFPEVTIRRIPEAG
jgi:hypothetical protein